MRATSSTIVLVFVILVLVVSPSISVQSQGTSDPLLRLHRGTFDARTGGPASAAGALNAPVSTNLAIIQLGGPVAPADRRALEQSGVQLLEYLPDYAYLVSGSQAQIGAATRLPQVYAHIPFTLADKLSPSILGAVQRGATDMGRLSIRGWRGNEQTLAQELGNLPFDASRAVSRDELFQLASLATVRWIEPAGRPFVVNDLARDILGVNAAWPNAPLFGSGQIIGITDTGLDTGDVSSISPDFSGRITATMILSATGNWADEHGHGTHVAGAAAGAGVQSGADPATHTYASSFAGVAPEAELAIQAFEVATDGTGAILGLPADYYQLFDQMYASGARLHSNSWGDYTGQSAAGPEYGGYVYGTQRTDEFVWDHPEMTILVAAGNSGIDGDPVDPVLLPGFCGTGDGVINPDSLLSPGTAKNVITVGASEINRSSGAYGGFSWASLGLCFWAEPLFSDPITDDVNGMAAFSSRGPADDGRSKPDITAPGVNLISNRSHASGAGTLWGAYDANYAYSGGTSMATPLAAGTAALVREWLQRQGAANPSAALVKATLLNTTYDMAPGQYGTGSTQEIPNSRPNNVSGWGRADVTFMDPAPAYASWYDDHSAGVGTGNIVQYTDTVTTPLQVITDSLPLRVMLVWTDPPASLSASRQLVNDLDLIVTGPGGTLYYGNENTSGDRINNVEGIVIDSPLPGAYQVEVTAFNVPTATQPYALVVGGPMNVLPADMRLAIDDGGLLAFPGASIPYTLTYANSGSLAASGVVITETVPANTVFTPSNSAAGWSCSPDNSPGSICHYHLGAVGAYASRGVTFTVSVSNTIMGAALEIDNVASVGDDGTQGGDPTPSNNIAAAVTPLSQVSSRCGLSAGPAYLYDDGGKQVSVSINSPGDIECVRVQLVNSAHPGATSTMTDGYYWSLEAVNSGGQPASGFGADLIFPHASPSTLTIPPRACRYLVASGWDCGGAQSYDPVQVLVQGVTAFSDWAIAYDAGPTAVHMQGLAASSRARITPLLATLMAISLAALSYGLWVVSSFPAVSGVMVAEKEARDQ
jgi:uncharacterized repeat protein (TIGR01451 family)